MDIGCSLVWVAHCILGQSITNHHGFLMPFWIKPVQMDIGCSLVWVAHCILVQSITNRHGLLFSVGCSCHFGSNQFKWTWVALQCGLLLLFVVKPLQMGMGCSLVWVAHAILGQTSSNGHGLLFSVSCSCHFGSNHYKWVWVALQYGLLMPFWVKPVQMDMGCSLVWVAHAIWGQTITNRHGLLFSMGCSCHFGLQLETLICKDAPNMWFAHGLLRLLSLLFRQTPYLSIPVYQEGLTFLLDFVYNKAI